MRSRHCLDGKHIIGVNWYDVETVWIEGVDTGSTLAAHQLAIAGMLRRYCLKARDFHLKACWIVLASMPAVWRAMQAPTRREWDIQRARALMSAIM